MNFFACKTSLKRRICKALSLFLIFVPFYSLCRGQSQIRPQLAIRLLLSTEPGPQNTADGVVAFYADNFSTSIGNEDSYKFTNPDENLAINCRGTLLSIDGLPTIRGTDTLNLVMWTFRQNAYYLQFNASNFSSKIKAVVKDHYLHRETAIDLTAGTLLPFDITTDSASFARNRFDVILRAKRIMSQASAAKLKSVFKDNQTLGVSHNWRKGNEINLRMNNLKKGKYTVSLYTAAGEMIYAGSMAHDGSGSAKKVVIQKRIRRGTYCLLLNYADVTIKKTISF